MLDCVVVGAGLAGLTVATRLAEAGRDVVVLEARDRVGGRVENVVAEGTTLEMGGQWLAPSHEQMHALVQRFGLELVDQSEGDIVVRTAGRARQEPTRAEIAESLSPFETADLGQGFLRFRRLAERMAKDNAWREANHGWLMQDVSTWAATNLRTPGGREWFERVFEAGVRHPAAETPLVEALHHINNGIDLESLVAVNGGVRQQRVDGGVVQVAEELASALGGRVRLGCEVVRIAQVPDGVRVHLADGEVVEAGRVVVTLPPRLAVALDLDPALPSWRAEMAAKVPAGNVIKAALVYDEPWWRAEGLSGQLGSDDGAMRVIFDNSGPGDGHGVLMGFFEGPQASGIGQRSAFLRQRAMEETVKAAFDVEHPSAIAYVDRDWAAERFTGGCHGAHFAPGLWTASGPVLAAPAGRVFFAGAEYADKFNGYMEGAVRSGEAVADQLLG